MTTARRGRRRSGRTGFSCGGISRRAAARWPDSVWFLGGLARRVRRFARDGAPRTWPAGRGLRQSQLLRIWRRALSQSCWCPANSTASVRRASCAQWWSSFLRTFGEHRVAIVSGGDHFFAGHLPELDRVIAAWLLQRHPELAAREDQSQRIEAPAFLFRR